MKIRFVTSNTFPDGHAATSRVRCYARALLSQDADIEVVAPSNTKPLNGRQWLLKSEIDSIPYQLISNRAAPKSRLGKYFLALATPYFLLLHTLVTLRQSDLFIIYNNATITRFLMVLALRLFGKKVIIELNEYPFSPDGGRITQLPGIRMLMRFFVLRMVFPISNGFLVISRELERVVEKHAPKSKVLRIPILMEFQSNPKRRNEISREDVYLFHAGSLSEQKDGILAVFESFAEAHHMLFEEFGVRLKLYVTNMVAFPNVKQGIESILSRSMLHDYVIVTGFLEEDELQELISGSLAFIVNKPHNIQNQYNFPTKLAHYLSSGRPVILAAMDIEANQYLTNEVNALVVPPNDVKGMAKAVVRCFSEPEFAYEVGSQGAATARKYFYFEQHGARMFEFLKSV